MKLFSNQYSLSEKHQNQTLMKNGGTCVVCLLGNDCDAQAAAGVEKGL